MDTIANKALNKTGNALSLAIDALAEAVPKPSIVQRPGGPYFRYTEENVPQALVIKSVRTLSAFLAARTLIDTGLALDAGAMFRILDELGSDIMFLAGPIIFRTEPEKKHKDYLKEFFQEEFDHQDPVKSTQKRHRVSRSDIRAYVARTYSVGKGVSDIVAVTGTIENMFSGYVHGAASHTMDVYDGQRFCVPMEPGDSPLEDIRCQLNQYASRALMSVACAAKALGHEALFSLLFNVNQELYEASGDVRHKT